LLLWLAARLCAPEQLLTPERGDLARAAAFFANLLAEWKPALHSAGRLADRAIRIDGLNAYWHRPEYRAKCARREAWDSWYFAALRRRRPGARPFDVPPSSIPVCPTPPRRAGLALISGRQKGSIALVACWVGDESPTDKHAPVFGIDELCFVARHARNLRSSKA
jgi:hypothetical protein